MTFLRNSAKALIVKDGKLLCTKNLDSRGYFYGLPGGGQNPGETLTEALQRECREEISSEVVVHDLVLIREYVGANHEFAATDTEVHQIEFIFACSLPEGAACAPGTVPDTAQIGVEWLPQDRLHDYLIYPKALVPLFAVYPGYTPDRLVVYQGDVN